LLTTVSATCYVIPVLWTTLCFKIMGPNGQNQARRYFVEVEVAGWRHQSDVRQRYVWSSSPDGGTVGEVAVYDGRLVYSEATD